MDRFLIATVFATMRAGNAQRRRSFGPATRRHALIARTWQITRANSADGVQRNRFLLLFPPVIPRVTCLIGMVKGGLG